MPNPNPDAGASGHGALGSAGPTGLTIALLGAESTGKSTLARQLARVLKHGFQSGPPHAVNTPVMAVPEALRTWCLAHGRAPLAHEQADVARQQAQALASARRELGPQGWLIADTTPLMTAVYSEHYFGDRSLSMGHPSGFAPADLTLLMGLDLPWQADGPWRDGPATQQAIDRLLRQHLQANGTRFQTVYGQGEVRMQAALQAVVRALPAGHWAADILKNRAFDPMNSGDTDRLYANFSANCECCAVPECEQQLFSRLLTRSADQGAD